MLEGVLLKTVLLKSVCTTEDVRIEFYSRSLNVNALPSAFCPVPGARGAPVGTPLPNSFAHSGEIVGVLVGRAGR